MVQTAKLALGKERVRKKKKNEIRANTLLEIEIVVVDQRLGSSKVETSRLHRETPV